MRRGVRGSVAVVLFPVFVLVSGPPNFRASAADLEAGNSPVQTWSLPARSGRPSIAWPSVSGLSSLPVPPTALALVLPTVDAHRQTALILQAGLPPDAGWSEAVSLAPILADTRPLMLAPPSAVLTALEEQEPGGEPVHVDVLASFKYSYVPVLASGSNYGGPGLTWVTEPSLTYSIIATLNPNTAIFADIKPRAPTDSFTFVDVQKLNLELRNTLGVRDLHLRVGRDRVRLGSDAVALLLDEVVQDTDKRDGFEAWLPYIGSARVFGFLQYALIDRSTTRRVWGGRTEFGISESWAVRANYRADTAAAADAGACPGVTCNTGSGFGLDVEGSPLSGLDVTLAYASYTRTSDGARNHYQLNVVAGLRELAGIERFDPTLTVWYKNFDPYTLPGSDGTGPRGGFVTPDDINLFSINDNLTAAGVRLDLKLRSDLGFFALGEWGIYKAGGPPYHVSSAGFEQSLPDNVTLRLTFDEYGVAGGSITTSPVSGIVLSNALMYQVEVKKSW